MRQSRILHMLTQEYHYISHHPGSRRNVIPLHQPVLQIQGDKLDAYSKARSEKLARGVMIDAMKKDFETRFGGMNVACERMALQIAHTQNLEGALAFRDQVSEVFPGMDIYVDHLSLSVSCHIGPGSLALATAVKL